MSILAPQKGKQELAMNLDVDILIYGGAAGSGKSRLLLLKAAHSAYKDPYFEGVMFRRNTGPLKAAGGLFSEAKKLYAPLGVHIREKDMEILFKKTKGGNLKFTHLEMESDAEGNHQGLQYSCVMFDELTHFTQTQFLYLLGRMRSAAEGNSFCMATCNPDRSSWVLNWVQHYLNEDGKPDESKVGQKRYVLIVDDTPVFADTEKELADIYPDACWIEDNEGQMVYVPPMSYAVILGNIFDNPALIKANPKYLSALKAQSKINRERLLEGSWYAEAEGSNYFERGWLHKLDRKPLGCREARAWDLASSEPSDKYRKPDYTASVKMLKTKDGRFVIVGDYDPVPTDPTTNVSGKFRKRPGDRDLLILAQSHVDGDDCHVIIPKDPSSSGEVAYNEMAKFLISDGFKVKKDPTPNNKSKLKRFEPFSSACQNGLVSIVESTFTPQTLQAFYKELELFDGEPSTSDRKDDWPDATASVFNFLSQSKGSTKLNLPDYSGQAQTALQQFKANVLSVSGGLEKPKAIEVNFNKK